jgi:hypothetical protein
MKHPAKDPCLPFSGTSQHPIQMEQSVIKILAVLCTRTAARKMMIYMEKSSQGKMTSMKLKESMKWLSIFKIMHKLALLDIYQST